MKKSRPITALKKILASSVARNFLIYSGGTVLLKSISIILMPFVLKALTPAEYGLLSLTMSFISIFAIFSGLGLRQTLGIEYFHCTSIERRHMANDIIILYLAIAGPIFVLFACNTDLLNRYIFLNSASTNLIYVSLAYCFSQFFVELFYQLLRYQCRATALTILQVIVALSTISLNLMFLYIFKLSVTGMLLGYLSGALIASVVGFYAYTNTDCLRYFALKTSLKKCRYYLKISLPFVPGMLFNWVLAAGDKWVLARYATMHDVGIYALADTFGQAYQMLILYPLAGSYLPHLFQQFSQTKDNATAFKNHEQKNKQLMLISMIGMSILIVLGSLIGTPILCYLLPLRYHQAIRYVWFIFAGYVFLMGTYFTSALVQFHKKTLFLAFSLLPPALINIVLNILFIPTWGIMGCIVATITAYIIYFVTMLWYNRRLVQKI